MIDNELNAISEVYFLNDRISCCKIKQSNHYILLIGIYAECNEKLFTIQLNHIAKLITDQTAQCKPLILGDLNAACIRLNKTNENSKQGRIQTNITKAKYPNDGRFVNFLKLNSLECLDIKFTQHAQYTFKAKNKTSHIDHIIIRPRDNWDNIVQVNIMNNNNIGTDHWDLLNTSDHCPIELTILIEMNCTIINSYWYNRPRYITKFNWEEKKGSYKDRIGTILDESNIVDKLKRIYLNSELPSEIRTKELTEAIDQLQMSMIRAKEEVSDKYTITHHKYTKRKRGWDENLKEAHAHKKLQETNRTTNVYDKEVHSYYRNKFRRLQRQAINKVRNTQTVQLNSKFKRGILSLWREIKTTTTTNNNVDIDFETIKTHYHNTFRLNEHEINIMDENNLAEKIAHAESQKGSVFITAHTVNDILDKLKNNKASGFSKVSNEMYKFADRTKLTIIIQYILLIILNAHVIPDNMNTGLTFPLLKNPKGSNSELKNTRPITLSEVIDIIYEHYILEQTNNSIKLQQLQFGFNKDVSTQHAIFVLKETILHQLMLNLAVYVIFLDFSQAFDKIVKTKLLLKLHGILDTHVWLSLVKYCKMATIIIKNRQEISEKIQVESGVKQGGPASPKLFAIYIDQLIQDLKTSGHLCKVGTETTGVICYADDIAILCNTRDEANNALKIVEGYCSDHCIKINVEKTKWMHFSPVTQSSKTTQNLSINGQPIEKVEKFKYLGYWLHKNLKDNTHLKSREEAMLKGFFATNRIQYNNINLDLKIRKLFHNTYIRSKLMYGIENSIVSISQMRKLTTLDSTILKKGLYISKYSSLTKTLSALELENMEVTIKKRQLNFIALLAHNKITAQVLKNFLPNKKSILYELWTDNSITHSLGDRALHKLANLDCRYTNTEVDEEINTIKLLLSNRNKRNNSILDTLLRKYLV